ncbi:hypothetical protein [Paraburkholderia aspalathi]|uniref:Uncharacterized protein n=1 Tax=Paraburkholderia aspalathi TaxID=1324617 RepID=A0A1I7EPY0_9BURK|nr:hypothetical protein [Paraburkholderia aspalathi]SFU25979.1 hypothetical protein SAMN05192563_10452 [Paraburkholderia aspalathi]
MQLDIFNDSRDVMLRNDVLSALQRYDAAGARRALQALVNEYPDDVAQVYFGSIVNALEGRSTVPFDRHDALQARQSLSHEVQPAVAHVFPRQTGAAWLAPLWAELAGRAAALPFRPHHADAHAAPLFLLAARWAEASDAISHIASWRRIPAPLCWMTEARYRLDGLDAAWPLLVELAWLSPSRFDQLLSRLGDSSIKTLRRVFDTSFDGAGDVGDLAWFPAWVLTEKAGLAPLFKQAEPSRRNPPERAAKTMLELLSLERQGRHQELLETRRELQALNAALYAAYMKTR